VDHLYKIIYITTVYSMIKILISYKKCTFNNTKSHPDKVVYSLISMSGHETTPHSNKVTFSPRILFASSHSVTKPKNGLKHQVYDTASSLATNATCKNASTPLME